MKKNILRICVALMGITMVSCLEDEKYALDPSGTENVIEFLDNSIPSNPAGAIYPVWTATTEISAAFVFEQTISYSGPNGNDRDIELTLAVDPQALADYNTQMTVGLNGKPKLGGGTYELMPANYFEFDDLTVTIPKGQTKVNISITAKPDQFDLTKNWALPIRIVSSSSGILSSNFSTAILAVVVKNKYDGIYDILDGQVTRLVGGVPDLALGGQYNEGLEMDLATVNGNTVGVVPLWKDGSGIGGIPGVQFMINETTNDVTVTATGNATLKNMAGTTRIYDPEEKTFEVSFDWSTPGTREVKNLKLKFNRPRP
jgi:Domain of unknown function (DUF1735)